MLPWTLGCMCLFDTCPCIIILTFHVFMKLGEAVTYPGLEGVSFFKNVCVCVCVCVFIWLHQLLVVAQGSSFFVVACRIFSCGTWDLVPWPRIKPQPPALGVQIVTTGLPGKSPEDVSLYGNILCSLCVSSSFGGEPVLSWAWAASLLRVCWEPPLWWELRLDLEGLETGASWGFSNAQWPSLPSWDQGWGLPGVELEPQGRWVSSRCDGNLHLSLGRAWELEDTLLYLFHVSPGVHALVRGWAEEGGVDATSLSWLSPLPCVPEDTCSSNACLPWS